MAKYPIKMLKDENNTPFVPLVGTDAIVDPSGDTLEQKLAAKLESTNIIQGPNITLEKDGNNITISATGKGAIIDNLDTTEPGVGALDARQGNILKNMIPTIANNLTTIDATQTLSAYQGYILNNRVVPKGGDEGQVLKKSADGDWQLEWGDAADPNAISGDGSIKKIIYLTWDEYKTLKEIDEYTEYHIADISEDMTYLSRDDIQDMIDNTASNYLLKTGGTLTGDITVKQGTTDEPTVRVDNGTYQLDMIVGSGGTNRGLYDRKSGKYLIYADVNDVVTVSGHATSDLALTGGTLSGNLTMSKDSPVLSIYSTNTTAQVIKMGDVNYKYNLVTSYGNGTTYGANTAIQSGGALALGGGEAATNLLSAIGASTYDAENLFVLADGAVYIESNCQSIDSRLGFVLNSAGELLPVKKETLTTSSGTIGNASYKLKGLYVDDIYLSTGTHSIKGAGNKDVLRDHGNGNVTLDATGGDLYLGWQTGNTSRINIFNGNMFITQYGGARIEPQTNSGGTWINMTHGAGAALYNGIRNSAPSGGNASPLWGIKTQNGAWGCGVLSGSDALYFVYGTDGNYNSGTNTTSNAYISSAGAFTSASARKTKENIQPYTDKALDIINDTLICSFNYKADNNKSYRVGFIADDTNSIMSGEEHDSFDINNTVGLLLKAVQELSEENKQLKERIEKIEG